MADLARKTKGEILQEYKRLREQLDEARHTAAQVQEPRSQELLAKTEKQTEEDALLAINNLRSTLNNSLNKLAEAVAAEVGHLNELRQSVALWKKNLEHHQNLVNAADALDALVVEYEMKKRQFEAEAQQRRFDLETELADKLREEQRSAAEKEYETKLAHKREEEEWAEKTRKREKELAERAEAVKQQENEVSSLRLQVNDFTTHLEDELKRKEEEVSRQLKAEQEITVRQLKQEREAEGNVFALQIDNLREQNDRYQKEIATLRTTVEGANKQSQALAAKVIESNRPVQVMAAREEPT